MSVPASFFSRIRSAEFSSNLGKVFQNKILPNTSSLLLLFYQNNYHLFLNLEQETLHAVTVEMVCSTLALKMSIFSEAYI